MAKKIAISISTKTVLRERLMAEKWLTWPIVASAILLLVGIGLTAFKTRSLPPEVPVFYSKPWGEERLAARQFLWILPAISALVIILNTILVSIFAKKIKFLAQVIAISLFVLTVLIILTLVKIIFLSS